MVIGLTGGIASGKSTAARLLGELGAHVIDADKLGHQAYAQGSQAYTEVIETFGADVVGADGEIDRKVLGGKVFGSGNRLDELTAIVWPAIHRMATEQIDAVRQEKPEQIVVLEAAVLIEAGWLDLVDEVWVTVVDPEVAITRASARDGTERADVQARIDAQLSNAERQAKADRVIDNSHDEQALVTQVKQLWAEINANSNSTK
ncbi:MAG: dephospho-CoA kinase [Pseudomonadota bacterium]